MKEKILLLALLLMSNFNAHSAEGKSKIYDLTVGKLNRSYQVYEPADLKKSAAVMLVLHGGTGSASHSMQTMGFQPIADKEKFLVVFANGTSTILGADRRVWNAGLCCAAAVRKNIDDVGFIKKMLVELQTNYSVDPKRIYVTGMSNGAMMTYRLICELQNTFAAAIPVAGSLTVDDCQHGTETAILHIHGLKDSSVPYAGGVGEGLARIKYRPLQETIDLFAKMKKCSSPTSTTKTNGDETLDYNCGSNPPVRLMKIKNLTHAWPGGSGRRAQPEIELSAPVEAWTFAKQFSLK
jgi:polyhydroxybutyrate depolymerase